MQQQTKQLLQILSTFLLSALWSPKPFVERIYFRYKNISMFSNSYLYERSLIIVRNIFMVVQYLFLIL